MLVALATALCLSGCGMVNPALGYVIGGLEASADDPRACCDVLRNAPEGWEIAPFGNDVAADWAWELDVAEGWSFIDEALRAGMPDAVPDEIDVDIALAAAETVAHGLGSPTQDDVYTESVSAFVERVGEPPAETVELAQRLVSELLVSDDPISQLYADAGYSHEWEAMLAGILAALSP